MLKLTFGHRAHFQVKNCFRFCMRVYKGVFGREIGYLMHSLGWPLAWKGFKKRCFEHAEMADQLVRSVVLNTLGRQILMARRASKARMRGF